MCVKRGAGRKEGRREKGSGEMEGHGWEREGGGEGGRDGWGDSW